MMQDDGYSSTSSIEQQECEASCRHFFIPTTLISSQDAQELQQLGLLNEDREIRLLRQRHIEYLKRGLKYLPGSFRSLDSSRPWLCYWMLHGLDLLGESDASIESACIDTLKRFQNSTGGFGGNNHQMSHTAPTYASCLTLALIGTEEAYATVDRAALYQFFLSLKDPATGAFAAHDHGEVDIRVTYCVIAIASLYCILTDELSKGVAEYALQCQTYEGGFGGEPGNEAHGGYAFCATATLFILDKLHLADLEALKRWISQRQMSYEGGYQGRTNKLVDGCYSFWQGAIPTLISLAENKHQCSENSHVMANYMQLQRYILFCCQQVEGGLRDKPGKPRDHYHSCYCLSGLSIAQHGTGQSEPQVLGDPDNLLLPTHPAYNINTTKVEQIHTYFRDRPFR